MADKEKSIIERALLDVKRIQETLNANTKEILRSVAKEEIDGIVKESLMDEDYMEEDVDANLTEDENLEEVELEDESEDEENEEEFEIEDEDESEEDESEEEGEEFGGEEEDEEEDEIGMAPVGDELDTDSDEEDGFSDDDDDFEIDMTTASDDEVIAVYKKLTGDDEIKIVFDKDEDTLEIDVEEPGQFIVKNVSKTDGSEEMESDVDDVDSLEESDLMYEIEIDEDYMEEETMEEEETMDEVARTKGAFALPKAMGAKNPVADKYNPAGEHIQESKQTKQALTEAENKYKTLLAESKELKTKNEEYKEALKNFRTMLAETVVFNSNLTYVTKLFMEHSTTKEEKQNILKRFDEEVTTIKESKRLYKTIANELSSKTPIKESVEKTLVKEAASGTSKQIHESTAYVDKETQRIMDLMKRVENR
jgi:hypothetical protein